MPAAWPRPRRPIGRLCGTASDLPQCRDPSRSSSHRGFLCSRLPRRAVRLPSPEPRGAHSLPRYAQPVASACPYNLTCRHEACRCSCRLEIFALRPGRSPGSNLKTPLNAARSKTCKPTLIRRRSINRNAAQCWETSFLLRLAAFQAAFGPLEADAPVCVYCRSEGSPRSAHGCAAARGRAEVLRGENGGRFRPHAWKQLSETAQRCAWKETKCNLSVS